LDIAETMTMEEIAAAIICLEALEDYKDKIIEVTVNL
jgi:hypothetical protein